MIKQTFYAALSIGVLSLAGTASILPVTGLAGQTPDALSLAGMTLLASETNVALNSLTFSATLSAAVYSGNNVFCPTTNCLTFAYQVTDTGSVGTGTGVIEDLTASVFSGFSVDAGDYSLGSNSAVFTAGGLAPNTVSRTSAGNGSVVTFDYPNPPSSLIPGTHTQVLLVETNAVSYTSGLFSAIDGATATVVAYEPLSATPEPSSLALLGSALVGMGLMLKGRRRA